VININMKALTPFPLVQQLPLSIRYQAIEKYRFHNMVSKTGLRASLTISLHSIAAYGYGVIRAQIL
jgi:hypothetical protein